MNKAFNFKISLFISQSILSEHKLFFDKFMLLEKTVIQVSIGYLIHTDIPRFPKSVFTTSSSESWWQKYLYMENLKYFTGH